MKALVLDQPGAFEHLRLADHPLPQPGPGEVRVRVAAASLNPVDYKLLRGGHPAWTYPFILGLDVAGEVDAVGDGADQWHPGDRVLYHGNLAQPGGFAEYTTAPAHIMARIPGSLSFTEAAALPCAGLTAYQAIDRKLHLNTGDTILVQAGAGGVGGFAIQLAADRGATVFTTCSPQNNDYVRQLGAAETIDYHTETVALRALALTEGRGVDAVIDTLGTATATAALDMLAFGGQLVCIEALPDFAGWHMFNKAISVHEIALGGAHSSNNWRAQEDLARMAAEFSALVAEGRIDPMIGEVVPLDGIPDALQRLAGRHVRGKIVAKIG